MRIDRRTLLDQRAKMLWAAKNPELPDDIRAKAQKVADHAEITLGMNDALTRKLGSQEAVDSLLAKVPDPADQSPYPPLNNPLLPTTT